jgi:hypothetical protein
VSVLRSRLAAPAAFLLLLGAAPAPTDAVLGAVGATSGSEEPATDRLVPEPLERVTYLGYEEFNGYLDQLAARYPRFVTVGSMGTSEEGRDLVTLELTDAESEVAYEDRGVLYLSQGIHANEPGGREGMIRVAEDLLIEATAGDEGALDSLGKLRVVQSVTNVDGWASGELLSGGIPRFLRENADGVDLNRELPWPGRVDPRRDHTAHAESAAMVADADARREAGERIVGTADTHGMVQDESAVWTMFSSGQFDLGGWVRQIEMAGAIDERVRDVLGPVELLREATGAMGSELVTAHRTTTSSEFKGGLSGSGFYGDFLAQREGLDAPSVSTIELFFNNGPAGSYNQATFVAPVVQAHVDSVRAIVRGMIATALVEHEVAVTPPGRVGVVEDPRVIEVPDTPQRRTTDDTVTPMRFFDDLDPFLDAPTVRVAAASLTEEVLAELSVLVVPSDAALADAGARSAIRSFAAAGGTVVLTDAGLRFLPALDARLDGAVAEARTSIGNARFTDVDHPLAEGVRSGAFEETLHTYEPSTLGYDTETRSESPVWRVDRTAWEAAGGTTVATTANATSIGELQLGEGRVRIIGGLLPMPTMHNDPPFGLANYAPNDTGYLVFVNALGATLDVTEVAADFGPAEDDRSGGDRGRRPAHAGQPGPPDHAGTPGPPAHRGGVRPR